MLHHAFGDGHQPSLEGLMDRVARGDHAAFEIVYDRLAPQVYGVALQMLRDPQMSEEVAQEVLLEVWRHARRVDAQRSTTVGWVLTIARRRAIDRVRSEQSARDRDVRVGCASVDRGFDGVAEVVQQRAEVEAVRRALGALTHLQRQSVELAFFSGYTYREVAALLGAPHNTIKTRMRDGLHRLRAAMVEGDPHGVVCEVREREAADATPGR